VCPHGDVGWSVAHRGNRAAVSTAQEAKFNNQVSQLTYLEISAVALGAETVIFFVINTCFSAVWIIFCVLGFTGFH